MELLFKALAHETRREVLTLLAINDMKSGEITKQINLSSPAISNHLNILVTSGLVKRTKNNRRRIYTIQKKEIKKVISFLDGLIDGKF